jgi:arylsulfatase A-like enzyme
VADWAGADLGKINFGFKTVDAPNDQWNLKYLIRQGPAEIRLFLSLFTHNDFGKKFLPEIFYLAGVPLTRHLGRQTRKLLSEYAQTGEPFFLTFFSATTHVPFGSDYPYYTLFTDPEYTGESRFTMTKLATPEEIIEKQELGKEAYDVDQIINLYDGCVRQFDDEVKGIVGHLQQCGLQENTIIVIYSDHGADFFETGCWGQGNTLFGNDPSNRVPLLIIDPSKKGGFKVNQVTRVVDFLPTMQQLMGIESSSESDGVSLVDLMEQPDKPMRLSAYQETGMWLGKVPGMHPQQITYPNLIELLDIKDKQSGMLTIKPEYYPVILKAKNRSIRNERWKLIYIPTLTGVEYMLFDMQDDPGCLKDVREKNPDVFDELKARLDAWIDLDAG